MWNYKTYLLNLFVITKTKSLPCKSQWVFFPFYPLMDLTSIPSPAADIDECSTGKAVCSYNRRCVNTFGSFYCKCQLGYELKYTSGHYNCVGKSWPVDVPSSFFLFPPRWEFSSMSACPGDAASEMGTRCHTKNILDETLNFPLFFCSLMKNWTTGTYILNCFIVPIQDVH